MENTSYTYLMYKASSSVSTYSKLVDIKDYPAFGDDPEMLDASDLSSKYRKFVFGMVGSTDGITFTCNYDEADYDKVAALTAEQDLAIWFGGDEDAPSGDNGKFSFKGYVSVSISAGSTNAVREMIVKVAPTTSIEKS